MDIPRSQHLTRLRELLSRHPVVGLIGARQVGKSTLARTLAAETDESVAVFDLENSEDVARLADPLLALEPLQGLVILDAVQRCPDLFPILRVLADRPGCPSRFLVLGSASPELLRQSSETLAGRIVYHHLSGLDLSEVGIEDHEKLWLRGGFPRSFTADTDAASMEWRRAFVRTFIERDLPQPRSTSESGQSASLVCCRTYRRCHRRSCRHVVVALGGQTWSSGFLLLRHCSSACPRPGCQTVNCKYPAPVSVPVSGTAAVPGV